MVTAHNQLKQQSRRTQLLMMNRSVISPMSKSRFRPPNKTVQHQDSLLEEPEQVVTPPEIAAACDSAEGSDKAMQVSSRQHVALNQSTGGAGAVPFDLSIVMDMQKGVRNSCTQSEGSDPQAWTALRSQEIFVDQQSIPNDKFF